MIQSNPQYHVIRTRQNSRVYLSQKEITSLFPSIHFDFSCITTAAAALSLSWSLSTLFFFAIELFYIVFRSELVRAIDPYYQTVTVSLSSTVLPPPMYVQDNYVNGSHDHSLPSSQSVRDVSYSCGACGYELNLCSSQRNTSTISSEYGKSMKRGIISFLSIDESRFTQMDEYRCLPYVSKNSWGLFRKRTKLLCRKCGKRVGTAYEETTTFDPVVSDVSELSPGKKVSTRRKYDVRIRALQLL